jgi:hypothetical protein
MSFGISLRRNGALTLRMDSFGGRGQPRLLVAGVWAGQRATNERERERERERESTVREVNKGEGKGRTAQARAVLGILVAFHKWHATILLGCHNDTPQNCGVPVRHASKILACQSNTSQFCGVSVRHASILLACWIQHATNNFSEVLWFNTPLISEVSKTNLL